MPLTAKKSGLLLRALEFRIKGFVAGKMRAILRRYGSTTPLVDLSLELIRGYNDVVLDMGGFPLEKGVEYQLYLSAVNNFYPPSVEAGWVEENDFIDIAHGQRLLRRRRHPHLRGHCRAAGSRLTTTHIS